MPRRARQAQRDAADQFKVVYDFQFPDRVTESGITFVHRVVDDAARFHKAGALRSRHRHRRGGRRRRRPRGPLLRQSARRQPALEESRRRQVQKHQLRGGRRAGRPSRRDRLVRGHRQRRRPGSLRHHGPRRQRPVRERRPRPFQGHLQSRRRRLRRPLVGRGVLRLRQRRPARPVCLQRRPLHDQRRRDRTAPTSGCTMRSGTPASRPFGAGHPVQEHGPQPVQERHQGGRPGRCRLERRRERRRSERRRLSRSLRAQHAGADHFFEIGRRQEVRRQDREVLSENALGQHGHQVLRLRQRRAARPAHHRHALRHERGGRPRAREAQGARCDAGGHARGGRTGSSSATPSTAIAATESSRKSRIAWARRTTGRGDRASET